MSSEFERGIDRVPAGPSRDDFSVRLENALRACRSELKRVLRDGHDVPQRPPVSGSAHGAVSTASPEMATVVVVEDDFRLRLDVEIEKYRSGSRRADSDLRTPRGPATRDFRPDDSTSITLPDAIAGKSSPTGSVATGGVSGPSEGRGSGAASGDQLDDEDLRALRVLWPKLNPVARQAIVRIARSYAA